MRVASCCEPTKEAQHRLDTCFYPRDAMLARVLAMAVSVSVCLSVASRCSIETDERIELVLGTGASFRLSYTVLKGNSGISKIRVLPSETVPNYTDLENFASVYRSSKRVIDFARERWTLVAW